MVKNENDFPKLHTLHTSFEKKLKIFPFENPMSSVSRESSRLKSFTGIQSNLLRSRLAAFKGVFNSCRSSIASKIEKWKICTELKSFNYMDFKVTFFALQKDILISKQEEDAHRPFLSSSTYNIYYFCFAIIFVRIHIAKSYYY